MTTTLKTRIRIRDLAEPPHLAASTYWERMRGKTIEIIGNPIRPHDAAWKEGEFSPELASRGCDSDILWPVSAIELLKLIGMDPGEFDLSDPPVGWMCPHELEVD